MDTLVCVHFDSAQPSNCGIYIHYYFVDNNNAALIVPHASIIVYIKHTDLYQNKI